MGGAGERVVGKNVWCGKFLKAEGLYVSSRAVKRVCERHPRSERRPRKDGEVREFQSSEMRAKRCKGPPACGHAAVLNSEI